MEDLENLTLAWHTDGNNDRGKQRISCLIISCKLLAEQGIEEMIKRQNLLWYKERELCSERTRHTIRKKKFLVISEVKRKYETLQLLPVKIFNTKKEINSGCSSFFRIFSCVWISRRIPDRLVTHSCRVNTERVSFQCVIWKWMKNVKKKTKFNVLPTKKAS